MTKNYILFFVLSALLFVGWMTLSPYIWPPPPRPEKKSLTREEAEKLQARKKEDEKKDDKKAEDRKKGDRKPEHAAVASIEPLPVTPDDKLIDLGEQDRHSRFHLFVQLDPRGAGLRRLVFNKFQAADDHGRPVWTDPDKKTIPQPLELVPADLNAREPSFLLYAFDVEDPTDDKPLDRLGRIEWKIVDRKSDETDDHRRRESVSLEAETQGVIVTKTYTLTEGEYHLGLAVKLRRKAGADKSIKVRYQMTGAHGLPVEGKYYTPTFRNALIARVDKDGYVGRELQDLRQISHWGGGNDVNKDAGNSLLYAGVANQFFASVIVVDNEQKNRSFLDKARPTLEKGQARGVVASTADDGSTFVLKPEGGAEETFHAPSGLREQVRRLKGARLAVLYHTGSYNPKTHEYPEIADRFTPLDDAEPALWLDDVTVRVRTELVELKDDVEVVHKYLLYNGPVKVNQLTAPVGLGQKSLEDGGVDPALVQRYHDDLHLNTLTDYHSPGAMGKFASTIYWTDLVVWCTNLMHRVLAYIHAVIPSYGLCIIVLTLLVRGMMFPLSRKQALMSMRMQQLAPELKKLQEKYKDDRQALGMAQMEMYRKHGVNPFGSCWVLLLQMPIFMGLYFALQESIHFRLGEFWPTWITNLAAPDMLFSWSEHIPYLSRVQDYGSFLYLGPYFNLLPVIAVALMIAQQKMMTPPPADEQQAMQQKMMKYMMIFFGLMFYKVAAGLCLYFITSSVWGFCERKLLPKKKPVVGEISGDSYLQKMLRRARGEDTAIVPAGSAPGTGTANGGITSPLDTRGRSGGKRGRNKRRAGPGAGLDVEADDTSALGRLRKRLRDWWIAILKEAEKKNRG